MIQDVFNGMLTLLLARFVLNDLPHAAGLFDWSTSTYKPAITGYLFHNTAINHALKILEDGYLKPFAGSTSFTLDPCFTVADPSVTFIFPESVIREKYGGKEITYHWIKDPQKHREAWESEMEVEVKQQLVYTSDCVEILPGRDCCWKYGRGYKYPYVDVRYRKGWPWAKFREFAVPSESTITQSNPGYPPRIGLIPKLPEEAYNDILFREYIHDLAKYQALSEEDAKEQWEAYKRQHYGR